MNVSIVIAAYNAAAMIQETLDAVLAQTHGGWEAIVVDDGSTDHTRAIVEAAARAEPRIRLVSRPHGGGGAARNAGIAAARFDWLLFLDADDLIHAAHL
ncbi:MAG: glycosyltransferase family 2 protein, partial [Longimicrobiales bacterium]